MKENTPLKRASQPDTRSQQGDLPFYLFGLLKERKCGSCLFRYKLSRREGQGCCVSIQHCFSILTRSLSYPWGAGRWRLLAIGKVWCFSMARGMSLYNRPICHAGRHCGTGIHLVLCLAGRETGSGRPSKRARGGLGRGVCWDVECCLLREKFPSQFCRVHLSQRWPLF